LEKVTTLNPVLVPAMELRRMPTKGLRSFTKRYPEQLGPGPPNLLGRMDRMLARRRQQATGRAPGYERSESLMAGTFGPGGGMCYSLGTELLAHGGGTWLVSGLKAVLQQHHFSSSLLYSLVIDSCAIGYQLNGFLLHCWCILVPELSEPSHLQHK